MPAKSKSNGDPGLWVRRRSQWVRFEVEALGLWREVSGSPVKLKLWVRGAIRSRRSGFVARSLWVAGEVGALGSWCERRRRDLTRTLPLSRRVQIVVRGCVDCSVWLGVWVGAVKLYVRLREAVRVREEWKMFEVKIWAENHFRWFWLILQSN